MKRSMNLLPQISLSILVALSLKPRHGYEIIKQVEQDSLGKISMSPGSLYGALKQLIDGRLIRELPHAKNDRRRYYELTPKGNERLQAELDYLQATLTLGRQRTTSHIRWSAGHA